MSHLALACGEVNAPYSFSDVLQGLAVFPLLPLGRQKRRGGKVGPLHVVFIFRIREYSVHFVQVVAFHLY